MRKMRTKLWIARALGGALLILIALSAFVAIFRTPGVGADPTKYLSQADVKLIQVESVLAELKRTSKEEGQEFSQPTSLVEDILSGLREANEILKENLGALSRKESELSSEMFQIMVSLFAIFGVFLTIAVAVGSWFVKHEILDSVDEEIESQLSDRIEFGTQYAQAVAYAHLAFTWWELYESDYQSGENKRIVGHVRNARLMSGRGYRCCQSEAFKNRIESEKEPYAWYQKAALLNHWVYHRTVELELQGDDHEIDSEVDELIKRAREVESCVFDERVGHSESFWFEAYETVGFALAKHGTPEHRDEGKRILRRIIRGNFRPSSSSKLPGWDFRRQLFEEHNEQFDLGLGSSLFS